MKSERRHSAPAHGARRFRALLTEYALRQCEALKVYQPFGEGLRLHQSLAKTRLCLGSNRSGKTIWGSCEDAWIATGTHPYRKVPKENGKLYIVGWDQEFIGKVMAPKLLYQGAFQIIRDEFTKGWRPVIPDQPYDAANKEKWKDAPPILPERWIRNINWESKKDNVPRDIQCVNGTTITYYSSKGAPQRGNEIHHAHIDEEIENKDWPRELQRGLTKFGGSLIYTATPQSSSPWLYNAYNEANEPEADKRLIDFCHLHVKNNIYMSEEGRQDFRAQLQTEDDVRVCWDGEFRLGEAVVYPEFRRDLHVLAEAFDPPKDWNRWMVIDPGVTKCAITFWAIPSPRKGSDISPHAHEKHCYDGVLIKQCSAAKMAAVVKQRMGDLASGGFTGFILDWRMGRQTQMGAGITVEQAYADALKAEGVWSLMTGNNFWRGSDNIEAREEAFRAWFSPPFKQGGTPILRIHPKAQRLIWELPRQFYKQDTSGLILKKRVDKDNDATTTAEYFAEANPSWIDHPGPKSQEGKVEKYLRMKKEKEARRNNSEGGVSFGPPALSQ